MPAIDRLNTDFGTRMKHTREARGVSLRQIAESTKLSVRALEALERNEISRLPGGIFSRAFVRSYAVEIGLDPEQTVREFLMQFPHDSVTAGSPHATSNADGDPNHSRRTSVLWIFAVTGMVIAAVLYSIFLR